MARPNRLIEALKKRNYKDFLWESILWEYRQAKAGSTTTRLGSTALPALINALKELEGGKVEEGSMPENIMEIEEWLSANKK
jgi:hypothetical protein